MKLKPGKVNWLIQYHPANRYQNWCLNSDLTPKFMRKMTHRDFPGGPVV